MNKELQEWILKLEMDWSQPSGFLGKAREGVFDKQEGIAFVTMLESIKVPDESFIDKRLVALLWYIPSFLGWQKERIVKNGGNIAEFERFANKVQGAVENILGVP